MPVIDIDHVENCRQVTHHARNGVLALKGQMLALRDQLDRLGVLGCVNLKLINDQIDRIGDAVDRCNPGPVKKTT